MAVVKEKAEIKWYIPYGENASFGTYDCNILGFLQLPLKGKIYSIPVKHVCECKYR